MSAFVARLREASERSGSLLCVGLDPDPAAMPVADVFEFNRAIVDATAGSVCAYKPNLAFYEALGARGMTALEQTISYIHDAAPGVLVIGDGKRGDIGPSAKSYAKAMFEVWGFDAITVNPWGGADSVEPFLEDDSRGVFVWCRGSNPGAGDFQDLETGRGGESLAVYQRVARACMEWNTRGNVGLVAGATAPEQLRSVREMCPQMPILIPGVGSQGGELEAAVRTGVNAEGRLAIVNSSRGIIYASEGANFAEAAGKAAEHLRDAINATLEEDGLGWHLS